MHAHRFLSPVLFTLLLTTSLNAAAETMPKVVVSATRLPTPYERVGSSVSVISEEDIERRNPVDAEELLQSVPGVTVSRSGGPGNPSSVFIRGTKAGHTLVIVDGVEMNDPSSVNNAFDFGRLPIHNIERIEVLRGPQSVLYGSDAIGGVILITTKQGKADPSVHAYVEGGSFASREAGVSAYGAVDGLDYGVGIQRRDVGGYSAFNEERGGMEKDGFEEDSFSTKLGYQVNDQLRLRASARYADSQVEFDDFGADSPLNQANYEQLSGRLGADVSLFEDRWQQEVSLGMMDLERDSTSMFGTDVFEGERTEVEWLHHVAVNDQHTATVGLETEEEEFLSSYTSRQSVRNHAVFVQDSMAYGNFSATAGLRYDDHDEFGGETTYRIAPSYRVEQTGTLLKGSYGTGFKAPTLYHLYSSFGDPNLKPETSKGFDLGFEQGVWDDRLHFGATYFQNDIEDLIDYSFATNSFFNVGDAETDGFELFVSLEAVENLLLEAHYTRTNTEDKATGLALLRRPRHQYAVDVFYRVPEEGYASLMLNYVGERFDNDFSFSRTELDDYLLVDVSTGVYATEEVEVYLKLENLLDEDYEQVYGFGTAGRSFYVGLKAGF